MSTSVIDQLQGRATGAGGHVVRGGSRRARGRPSGGLRARDGDVRHKVEQLAEDAPREGRGSGTGRLGRRRTLGGGGGPLFPLARTSKKVLLALLYTVLYTVRVPVHTCTGSTL